MFQPLAIHAQKMLTDNEKKDLIYRVEKLNAIGVSTRFKPELFNYACFEQEGLDYWKLVFLLRNFQYIEDEKLFSRASKKRVKKYKTKEKESVNMSDVCLLSFFKRLGVL